MELKNDSGSENTLRKYSVMRRQSILILVRTSRTDLT